MPKGTYIGMGILMAAVVAVLAIQLWPDKHTPLAGVEKVKPGDDDVVARIGSTDLTRRPIRMAAEYRQILGRTLDPADQGKPEHDLPAREATRMVILDKVDEAILLEAAKQNGIVITDAELDQYVAEMTAIWKGPDGGAFREYVSELGLGVDEYYSVFYEDVRAMLYRDELNDLKLQGAENLLDAYEKMRLELRATMPIEWLDIPLKSIYEEALADPTLNRSGP